VLKNLADSIFHSTVNAGGPPILSKGGLPDRYAPRLASRLKAKDETKHRQNMATWFRINET